MKIRDAQTHGVTVSKCIRGGWIPSSWTVVVGMIGCLVRSKARGCSRILRKLPDGDVPEKIKKPLGKYLEVNSDVETSQAQLVRHRGLRVGRGP